MSCTSCGHTRDDPTRTVCKHCRCNTEKMRYAMKTGKMPFDRNRLCKGSTGQTRTRFHCSACDLPLLGKGNSMCNECCNKHRRMRKTLRRVHAPPENGRCAICEETRPLCLDHNHKTGEFRGWLCSHRDVMLGMAGENMLVMAKAIGYVRGSR
jgi:hypothetical protein